MTKKTGKLRDSRRSFAPIVFPDTEVLVLGSMPGVPSLSAQQYYANPRNAFWAIIARLCKQELACDYTSRLNMLQQLHIGLWDVIAQCERPGSLDSAITPSSVVANDVPALLEKYPRIQRLALNGRTAETTFKRHFPIAKFPALQHVEIETLPSTSPAHAAMSFEEKYQRWRSVFISE